MLKEDLNDISELNEQIEIALEDSNFIQLASLSSKLETIVGILTKNSHYKTNIKKQELDELKKLLIRVDQYKVKTEQKFKDYTSRTSRQTKMQNAYRQSGG